MLKYFLQAYGQGYRDGLRGVRAPSVVVAGGDDGSRDMTKRPAYHAGFRKGMQDRNERCRLLTQPELAGVKVTYSE